MAKLWLRCGCCSRVFEIEGPDEICPDCLVKVESILSQAEPRIVAWLEDPSEPGWQAKHSKPAWEVKAATSPAVSP